MKTKVRYIVIVLLIQTTFLYSQIDSNIEFYSVQPFAKSDNISAKNASAIILVSWLDNVKVDVNEILGGFGYWGNYKIKSDSSLDEWGIGTEYIQELNTPTLNTKLLEGPFIISSGANYNDAKVVYGMIFKETGDPIIKFIDPNLTQSSSKVEMQLSAFVKTFDDQNQLIINSFSVVGTIGAASSPTSCNGLDQSPGGIEATYLTQRNKERGRRKCRMEKYLFKEKLAKKTKKGVVYFDDGKYIVKANELLRGGTKVGTLSIKKDNTKKIATIYFNYTDKNGVTQSGNLLDGAFASNNRALKNGIFALPGEGSWLWIKDNYHEGKKKSENHIGFGIAGWTKVRYMSRKKKKGYAIYGGGSVKQVLQKFKGQPIDGKELTSSEIDIFNGISQVESSGKISGINSHDSDVMSAGFIQFTLAGKLQAWIKKNPSLFQKYGIELADRKVIIKDKIREQPIKGVDKVIEIRDLIWALRFYDACLDKAIINQEIVYAREKIKSAAKIIDKYQRKSSFTQLSHSGIRTILIEVRNNRGVFMEKALIKMTQDESNRDLSLKNFADELQIVLESIYRDLEPVNACGKKLKPRLTVSNWESKLAKRTDAEKILFDNCYQNFKGATSKKASRIVTEIRELFPDLN